VYVYLGLHTQSDIDLFTFEVQTPAVRRGVKNLINVISTFEIIFGFKKQKNVTYLFRFHSMRSTIRNKLKMAMILRF
jgi:hypothetical protein